jgi:hypothetical protein
MEKTGSRSRFVRRGVGRGLMVVVLALWVRLAQAQESLSTIMTPEEACIEALGYIGCENLGKPNTAQQRVILYYAAAAVSPKTLAAGGAHGQNSLDAAEQLALQNCPRNGAADCKVLIWGENRCVGLAISYHDRRYGYSAGSDRDSAASAALAQCRAASGKNCVVITAPCAGDDPR